MSSGLVCNDSVSWVTFHSAYDFGYLVKILTHQKLPKDLEQFLGVVRLFFGDNVYDMKYLMRFCQSLYGGLDRIAKTMNVNRAVGKCHQAGSDSLLTWHAFQKMRDTFFVQTEMHKHAGVLYGLENKFFTTIFSSTAGCGGCQKPKLSDIVQPDKKPPTTIVRRSSSSSSTDQNGTFSLDEDYTSSASKSTGTQSPVAILIGDSIAVEKDSDDPYEDFRGSMVEMIVEKRIYSPNGLQELLNCFLHLNSPYHTK
ncbi:hypothetical protein CSA_004618 [Cucumis sativus]|uniref:Uncharacterized protein n=1 Tax=Cucumis sativus TaxID=3659 RepID=A0ACB6HCH0_CUCSA|nr:hypothetical protein CSA_004618 [Cucumis sativus]